MDARDHFWVSNLCRSVGDSLSSLALRGSGCSKPSCFFWGLHVNTSLLVLPWALVGLAGGKEDIPNSSCPPTPFLLLLPPFGVRIFQGYLGVPLLAGPSMCSRFAQSRISQWLQPVKATDSTIPFLPKKLESASRKRKMGFSTQRRCTSWASGGGLLRKYLGRQHQSILGWRTQPVGSIKRVSERVHHNMSVSQKLKSPESVWARNQR
jgi:hypothetical protein